MTSYETANAMAQSSTRWREIIAPFIGKRIEDGGIEFELVDVNDVGVLYWQKVGGSKKMYTLPFWDVKRLRDSSLPHVMKEGHAAIRRARELGWTPQERNKTARKHFYFDGPVLFAVYIINPYDYLFTVGDTTTSWTERAIELLESAAKGKQ